MTLALFLLLFVLSYF